MLESAESEHPRLTVREIFLKISNVSYVIVITIPQLNVPDRQTTCRSNTALCVATRDNVNVHQSAASS